MRSYSGERSGADWDAFVEYTKRVWFSNGIHHHYSMKKIEQVYGSVFEGILGERVSTKPVEVVTPFPWMDRKGNAGALKSSKLKAGG